MLMVAVSEQSVKALMTIALKVLVPVLTKEATYVSVVAPEMVVPPSSHLSYIIIIDIGMQADVIRNFVAEDSITGDLN